MNNEETTKEALLVTSSQASNEQSTVETRAQSPSSMKVCKGCGKELELYMFPVHRLAKDGHTNFCYECHRRHYNQTRSEKKGNTESNPLAQFTARELMRELYRRGYKGEITFTEVKVHKIKLNEM